MDIHFCTLDEIKCIETQSDLFLIRNKHVPIMPFPSCSTYKDCGLKLTSDKKLRLHWLVSACHA